MSKLRGVNVLWAAFSRMGTALHEYVDRHMRRRRLGEGDLFKSTTTLPRMTSTCTIKTKWASAATRRTSRKRPTTVILNRGRTTTSS